MSTWKSKIMSVKVSFMRISITFQRKKLSKYKIFPQKSIKSLHWSVMVL